MRYQIMGPLRVVDAGRISYVTARKMETLLAVLLIRCDRVVPLSDLRVEIWGDRQPVRAKAVVHVYVSQIRKLLRRPDRPGSPVVTAQDGYLLRRGDDEIDVNCFVRLIREGRSYARDGRHSRAIHCYEQALRLWRGPLLGDDRIGPVVDGYGTWLAEQRLTCLELLMESSLAVGRHRELIGRLYALALEHPLHEPFYRQLMVALYRADQRGDALRVYRQARAHLRDELGLEPGRPLQELHRAILNGETVAARTA